MESKYLFTSPAPVREPEAVAPNPPSGDVREAAGDFESGSHVPGGAGKTEGGGLFWDWDQTSPTLYGVLIKDVPRLVNYINGRVAVGDTDAAQKAYNQLSQFTSANADNLQAYARGKPRNQAQALMTQRARALLDGSVISNEVLAGMDPLANKRSTTYFRAGTDATRATAELWHETNNAGTASTYRKAVFSTAEAMAATGGVDPQGRRTQGKSYASTGANEFVELALDSEKSFKDHFGEGLSDAQVQDLTGIVQMAHLATKGAPDRRAAGLRYVNVLLSAGKHVFAEDSEGRKNVAVQAGLAQGLAAGIAQFAGGKYAIDGMEVPGLRLIEAGVVDDVTIVWKDVRSGKGLTGDNAASQTRDEFSQILAKTSLDLFNAKFTDVAAMGPVVAEYNAHKVLGHTRTKKPLSAKADAYGRIEQAKAAMLASSKGDQNSNWVRGLTTGAIVPALANKLQEMSATGGLGLPPEADYQQVMESILAADFQSVGISPAAQQELTAFMKADIAEKADNLINIFPGLKPEQAKALMVADFIPPTQETVGKPPGSLVEIADKQIRGLTRAVEQLSSLDNLDYKTRTDRLRDAAGYLVSRGGLSEDEEIIARRHWGKFEPGGPMLTMEEADKRFGSMYDTISKKRENLPKRDDASDYQLASPSGRARIRERMKKDLYQIGINNAHWGMFVKQRDDKGSFEFPSRDEFLDYARRQSALPDKEGNLPGPPVTDVAPDAETLRRAAERRIGELQDRRISFEVQDRDGLAEFNESEAARENRRSFARDIGADPDLVDAAQALVTKRLTASEAAQAYKRGLELLDGMIASTKDLGKMKQLENARIQYRNNGPLDQKGLFFLSVLVGADSKSLVDEVERKKALKDVGGSENPPTPEEIEKQKLDAEAASSEEN